VSGRRGKGEGEEGGRGGWEGADGKETEEDGRIDLNVRRSGRERFEIGAYIYIYICIYEVPVF
jgi:hypothetical protein